ncbi:MAG TPA: hypothetical protein VFY66_13525, partial [Anaerolineales bacterium]|nr:hypothetical protein [Anaerolineales bacterium]
LTHVPSRAVSGPSRGSFEGAKGFLGLVQHAYSHFSVAVHVFQCELVSMAKETNLKWIPLKDLDSYPMGKIDRQIAKMIAK